MACRKFPNKAEDPQKFVKSNIIMVDACGAKVQEYSHRHRNMQRPNSHAQNKCMLIITLNKHSVLSLIFPEPVRKGLAWADMS